MVRKETESQDRKAKWEAYDKFLATCAGSSSESEIAIFGNEKLELSYVFKDFGKEINRFHKEIAKVSLSLFLVTWVDEERQGSALEISLVSDFLESKLLQLKSLQDFASADRVSILEEIRCFQEWSIPKREEIALLYVVFTSWLSKKTFGYVLSVQDQDRSVSQNRQVPFAQYIRIINHLDLRERILAKMFYLGGSRGLEEVLSVKIEDIDFKKKCIHLEETVAYPKHLFEDIKEHIQDRKKGFLFAGKDGERISHTTSFRALKKVVEDLKLDPEFTFRELTKNI